MDTNELELDLDGDGVDTDFDEVIKGDELIDPKTGHSLSEIEIRSEEREKEDDRIRTLVRDHEAKESTRDVNDRTNRLTKLLEEATDRMMGKRPPISPEGEDIFMAQAESLLHGLDPETAQWVKEEARRRLVENYLGIKK